MLDRYFWLKHVDALSHFAVDKNNLCRCTFVDGIFVVCSNDGKCISYSTDGKNWVQSDTEEIRKMAAEYAELSSEDTDKEFSRALAKLFAMTSYYRDH